MLIFFRSLRGISLVLLIFSLVVATAHPAQAYVDPGSSLLVVQGAGAAFSAMLFFFRRKLKLIAQRLAGRRRA